VELILEDGRTLTLTPDHEILTHPSGSVEADWKRADQIALSSDGYKETSAKLTDTVLGDRVAVSLEYPVVVPSSVTNADGTPYTLTVGGMTFNAAQALALARIVGYTMTDGHVGPFVRQSCAVFAHGLGAIAAEDDVNLILGTKEALTKRYQHDATVLMFPNKLHKLFHAIPGVTARTTNRMLSEAVLPAFILDPACPVPVLREFLGGLFGGDGITWGGARCLGLHRAHGCRLQGQSGAAHGQSRSAAEARRHSWQQHQDR
jgi:hypothetical protein